MLSLLSPLGSVLRIGYFPTYANKECRQLLSKSDTAAASLMKWSRPIYTQRHAHILSSSSQLGSILCVPIDITKCQNASPFGLPYISFNYCQPESCCSHYRARSKSYRSWLHYTSRWRADMLRRSKSSAAPPCCENNDQRRIYMEPNVPGNEL